MRLIDADALMEDINESLSEMTGIGIAVGGDWLWAKLNDAIEHAPTIEPERKMGHWIKTYRNGFGNLIGYCNQCGRSASVDNYCPNCGAKMEED